MSDVIWPEIDNGVDYMFDHAIVIHRFADGSVELVQKSSTVYVPAYALKEVVASLREAMKANKEIEAYDE